MTFEWFGQYSTHVFASYGLCAFVMGFLAVKSWFDYKRVKQP